MSGRGMEIHSPASYIDNSKWVFQESKGTRWTQEENKQFEKALAYLDTDTPEEDKWFKVAALIPGKTVGDVIKHYRELEKDVSDIEAGFIPLPPSFAAATNNNNNSFTLEWIGGDNPRRFIDEVNQLYGKHARPSSDHDRKKGVPWTQEEHRQFLMGLKKYGKGDWRNISRYFVTTRTPSQVASHAQKYFIRQLNGGKQDKRRSSIHDITTVHLPDHGTDLVPSSPENKQQSPPENKQQQHQQMLGWSHTNTNPDSFLQISPLGIKFEEQDSLEISESGVYNLMQHHN